MDFISLRNCPGLKLSASEWFHLKWHIPAEAYLECMEQYLSGMTELGWYLCVEGGEIIGGLGVIGNDFHERKDLTPNVCAVYVESPYRCRGIAGTLLNMAVEDLRAHEISPVYLITGHTSFYERYGWEFYCTVRVNSGALTRLYIHR